MGKKPEWAVDSITISDDDVITMKLTRRTKTPKKRTTKRTARKKSRTKK